MDWLLGRFRTRQKARPPLVCYLRENGPIAYGTEVFGHDPRARADAMLSTDLTWYWKTSGPHSVTRDWAHPTRWSLAALLEDLSAEQDGLKPPTVSRSTFTGNWAGVDDSGTGSTYVDTIFWKNTLAGGISPGARYELDIEDGAGVRGAFIHGVVNDLRGTINRDVNTFDPSDPRFDARFVPQAPEYSRVGYRPVNAPKAERKTP